eukprot:1347340-Pyramimonas_sp.AAC.1
MPRFRSAVLASPPSFRRTPASTRARTSGILAKTTVFLRETDGHCSTKPSARALGDCTTSWTTRPFSPCRWRMR